VLSKAKHVKTIYIPITITDEAYTALLAIAKGKGRTVEQIVAESIDLFDERESEDGENI
jgi:hypothetical protein